MNKYDQELLDTIKRQRLQKMLDNSEFTWRTLPSLAKAIDATEADTVTILKKIGAVEGRKRARGGPVLFRAAA